MSDWDAIVVGSGIGGLGVAALLARTGARVLVLERHTVAGGLTHTFRRKGFEWDVGLHYLGKVHDPDDPLRAVFDAVTGGALGWASLGPVHDQVVLGDDRYDFVAGREALEASLASRFPRERTAITGYLDRVERVAAASQGHFLERALPAPLAFLVRPLLGRAFRREAARTTADVLAATTADPRLRAVLGGRWGNYGLPPAQSSFGMHALVDEFYLGGASYPIGGAGRIARCIVPRIAQAGGEVRLGARVTSILVRRGRAVGVRLEGGDEVTAPVVVSDAGLHNTLGALLPEAHRPRRLLERLAQQPLSGGHVALYLGLDGDAGELGLTRTNRWVHPSDDLDGNARRQGDDPHALPFVYLSAPSARDPAWVHPRRSTVTAIAPAPYAAFARWRGQRWRRRGPEYEDLKERFTEQILTVVLRELPALRGRIAHRELSTPLSTEHFTAHPDGAIYGAAHGPARFDAAWVRPASPVPGLFLVGQDVTTVGVGSALMSAVLTASVILRRNVLGELVGAPAEALTTPRSAT
jgi:all-trans-retinol 13,14-reductase